MKLNKDLLFFHLNYRILQYYFCWIKNLLRLIFKSTCWGTWLTNNPWKFTFINYSMLFSGDLEGLISFYFNVEKHAHHLAFWQWMQIILSSGLHGLLPPRIKNMAEQADNSLRNRKASFVWWESGRLCNAPPSPLNICSSAVHWFPEPVCLPDRLDDQEWASLL